MLEIFDMFSDAIKAYEVCMQCYTEDMSGLDNYDGGLRKRLFLHPNVEKFAKSLRRIPQAKLVFKQDDYGCCYCLFQLPKGIAPENKDPFKYCIIGPWQAQKPLDRELKHIIEKKNIPNHLHNELAEYLREVPLIKDERSWQMLLLTFAGRLYGTPQKIGISYFEEMAAEEQVEYNPHPETILSLRVIEDRYRMENALLAAVSQGNAQLALQCHSRLREQTIGQRVPDKMRNSQNYMLALNTLLRKAVENGEVHPAHIDTVSDRFARRILSASTFEELNITEEMIAKYCSLVQKFSLRGFSQLIQNVINTVDFNLREPLSLKILAEKHSVNASYLSSQFKKENQITLTDYINSKRLKKACSLLLKFDTPIQQIAEQCGFTDVNYFTRLFKRQYKKTPREFREELKT